MADPPVTRLSPLWLLVMLLLLAWLHERMTCIR